MRGSYELVNRNTAAVAMLNFNFDTDPSFQIHRFDIGAPTELIEDNRHLGMRRYKLLQPLQPGAKLSLAFDLEAPTPGFKNEGSNTTVVYNGSFLNGRAVLPALGYQEGAELERDQDRRKFGLLPKERMRDRDDEKGLQVNDLEAASDFIQFEANVSTEEDQIAIAPGYLQKEWVQDGRRHFSYKMDAPILNFFAFQSARYAEKRDVWHDADNQRDVQLEVYYQPGHEWNLDRMLASSKAALAYFSKNFGAYQYRQFRIIEFPRYETFAQSFPNTIPYSEAIGFIARVREGDPKDIDYPYYVTAHEAAHQWWGHQVVGAKVQGATALIETLAQYSALMVMKHRYGEGKMRKFLSYELDRYLRGRAFEQKKEMPLGRVENQDYIHYAKGSLVMYSLQDYIGEDKVNQALKGFRDAFAFRGPPYPNATQLIKAFRNVTPPELQYLIDDMFESIVLYDNRAVSAHAKKLPDGRYEVSIRVKAQKLHADALGKEEPVPLSDLIDIGVLNGDGEPLALRRERITQEDGVYTLTLTQRPVKAGIDPLTKLIDRTPRDNVIPVEFD
jgi:aminopeptidase N